jgi:hypothetical protein
MGNTTIDTDHMANPNSWERDNIELYLAVDTTSWNGQYGEADNQFRMQRVAAYPWGFDDSHSIGQNNADFLIGQVDAGDGSFVQEWQIPWAGLTAPMVDSGKFDGEYFKFEMQSVDNTTGSTGGRTQLIFWRNNSDNEYQDTRTFSLIKLESSIDTVTKDSISFISPVSSTVWKAGTANSINIFYNLKSGDYDYSIYYRKAGGSNIFIKELYYGGYTFTTWNIDVSEEGKYNIVLHDNYTSKNYYSDTFAVDTAVPLLALITPVSGSIIYSGTKFYITWSAYNSGNIDIEISKNNGVSWDTIAKNITSNNSSSNSYLATMPVFTDITTDGILQISNHSGSLHGFVANLKFLPLTSVITTIEVKSLKVFPNPFNNNFKMSYELLNRSMVEIGIYDLLGKYVKTFYSGVLSEGRQLQTFDLSKLNSGAYILQIKTSSGILKRMVVKK